LATTHLYSASWVPHAFEEKLAALVEQGVLEPAQRDEILAARAKKLTRSTGEAKLLLQETERRRARLGPNTAAILGGDFNAEPDAPGVLAIKAAGWTEAATGPDFRTWDPVANQVNYSIGTKRSDPLPTFDKAEVREILDGRHTTPRQIDHLFVSPDFEVLSARMVLDQETDGMYLSDHFAILATVQLR
jgi:endonuclease/exonuclease/phosphatase family metal-dependent hydrolase